MANARYAGTVDAVALVGAAAKTIIELGTTANTPAKVVDWWVEFDGTNAANTPVLVELLRCTGAATATTGTAVKQSMVTRTNDTVWKHSASSEGTPGATNLEQHRVSPTSGMGKQYPVDREIEIPISSYFRIRLTAAQAVNATAGVVWEE